MKIVKLMQAMQTQKHIRSIKTEPSPALMEIRYLNHILIPCGEQIENQSVQHSLAFRHNKTNPKQLYQFLRNQLIVVKQKERVISNHSELVRLKGRVEVDNKAICLKSEKEEKQFVSNSRLKTICLPKVESDLIHKQSRARKKREDIKLPLNPRRLYSLSSQKRISSLGSRKYDLQNTPLIHSASKSLSRQHSAKRQAKTGLSNSPSQVVNFSLYQQQPRMSKLSLNLVVQVARAYRKSISRQE